MTYTENALNVLTIRSYPKKGPAWIYNNIKGNESVAELCKLLESHEYEFSRKRESMQAEMEKIEGYVDGFVAMGDERFPKIRGNVKPVDRPFALFYKGDISLLGRDNLNIAVIGVLNPDNNIEVSEKIVTEEILKHNATIVSGLAMGCDSIAHRTALNNNKKTIAILPSTLKRILPKENIEMANEIVEKGGLLVSEYYGEPKGRNDMVSRFVLRDRLQAMFSDGILLSASYAANKLGNDSGSRHAMAKAKEYGIKRAVIYNDFKHRDNPMYDLNRQILSEDRSVIRIDSQNMSANVRRLVAGFGNMDLFT